MIVFSLDLMPSSIFSFGPVLLPLIVSKCFASLTRPRPTLPARLRILRTHKRPRHLHLLQDRLISEPVPQDNLYCLLFPFPQSSFSMPHKVVQQRDLVFQGPSEAVVTFDRNLDAHWTSSRCAVSQDIVKLFVRTEVASQDRNALKES
jgi:hypothetical protein